MAIPYHFLVANMLPAPTIHLEYGENIPLEKLKKLTDELVTAVLYKDGEPFQYIIISDEDMLIRGRSWEDHIKDYPEHADLCNCH